MSMFCGLPMSVAAEPTFAAHASARRNGTGFSPRPAQARHSTGAIERQTMSLLNTADSAATTATTAASSAGGDSAQRARRSVTHG